MNKVTTDTRRLNRIISASGKNNANFVKSVGFAVEGLAKMKAPIDTGALRNSIYTRTATDNPVSPNSDLELPNPKKSNSVTVGPSVEYGIYQEFGTRNMGSQPFLIPALREVERQLEANPRMASDIVNE